MSRLPPGPATHLTVIAPVLNPARRRSSRRRMRWPSRSANGRRLRHHQRVTGVGSRSGPVRMRSSRSPPSFANSRPMLYRPLAFAWMPTSSQTVIVLPAVHDVGIRLARGERQIARCRCPWPCIRSRRAERRTRRRRTGGSAAPRRRPGTARPETIASAASADLIGDAEKERITDASGRMFMVCLSSAAPQSGERESFRSYVTCKARPRLERHRRTLSCRTIPRRHSSVRDSPSPQPRPDMHVQQRAGPGSSTCEVLSTKESGALWRLNSKRC